jgi:outer membrane receptor protein involved in Fe transport
VQPGFTSSLSAKQAPDFFKSDSLWNYEAGTRTQWLHDTLHADATAYWVEWKNPQILQNDSTIGIPYLDNAGGVRSRGIETSLQWLLPLHGLTLSSAASYTRTETTKPFTTSEGDVIGAGAPWPLAPHWQTATTLSYLTDLQSWTLGAAVTHTYIGHAYVDLDRTERVFGFQQWDLQFSVGNEAIKWFPDITLNVSNLADKRALSSADDGQLLGPAYVDAIYIQPRMVTLRLSGRFY